MKGRVDGEGLPSCSKPSLSCWEKAGPGGSWRWWGLAGWLAGCLRGGGWPAQGSMMRVCKVVCLPLPFSPALQNEPWELENPMLAWILVEAFQLDPETLANEAKAWAANVA